MARTSMPPWAETMREIFRSNTVSQFIVSGNIHDLTAVREGESCRFSPLKEFLANVLFDRFDVVVFYDRGRGFAIPRGSDIFFEYMRMFDRFHRTSFAADAGAAEGPAQALESPGMLPRSPAQAVAILDRFVRYSAWQSKNAKVGKPPWVAVIMDYAHFILPAGETVYLSGEIGANLITVMNWARDAEIVGAPIATVLLTETLPDLNPYLVSNPHAARVRIDLPGRKDVEAFVQGFAEAEPELEKACDVPLSALASKLAGLSLVNIRSLLLRRLRNGERVTAKYLSSVKKEIIEKESFDKLEFIESTRTLDDVAGHHEAKKWLREDAALFKRDAARALPMGYLVTGRIGTGKTYLVQCFAGECGVPFVQLKNFRDKWVGSTEGNLEKIFHILHALGQVVVFVDEADQATGKRDAGESDAGLSGRIYAMLAKEMANTDNRGRILWIFATSRPDLLEVDLKRQGRLDVHIPLFPPQDAEGRREMFTAMAKKLKVELRPEDLPDLPDAALGGNEMEGLLVRAVRAFEIQPDGPDRRGLPEVLRSVAADFKPSAHTAAMELMDLLAVKECTDARFLPPKFKDMNPEAVQKRIDALLAGA